MNARAYSDGAEDDDGDCAVVTYAKTPQGPVHYASYDASGRHRGVVLQCYDCASPLFYRKQHTRTRNGITYNVRACFCHVVSSSSGNGANVGCGGGESAIHKAAKDAVRKWHEYYSFSTKCRRCQKVYRIDVSDSGNATALTEYTWLDYRLDVGFVSPGGKLTGAVEILHTHAISQEKRETLTRMNIAWLEVGAANIMCHVRHILQTLAAGWAPTAKDHVVWVQDCGMNCSKCWECQERGKDEDFKLLTSSESWHMTPIKKDALQFGIYQGFTISEILLVDPNYVRWLAGYTGYRRGKHAVATLYEDEEFRDMRVHLNARKSLVGRCLLCLSVEYMSNKPKWQQWCNNCYIAADIQ